MNKIIKRSIRKFFSRFTLSYFLIFSTVFNSVAPALLIATPAYAAESNSSSLELGYLATSHVLSVKGNGQYHLYYQTDFKMDASTGILPADILIGTESGTYTTPDTLKRGILKTDSQVIYFVMDGNNLRRVLETPSDSQDLSIAESAWLADPQTYGDLKTGVVYHAPFNQDVSVTFTSLPDNPGTITFNQITLSPGQIKESGAVNSDAYEITSDMPNSTFIYTLTLPNPTRVSTVGIEYSEDGQTFNAPVGIPKVSSLVTLDNLTHFTIFVVVYNSRPAILPGSFPSLGFAATSTSEFGDHIILDSTERSISLVSVGLTNWACENDFTNIGGVWVKSRGNSDACITTPGSSFVHPITLNIYNVDNSMLTPRPGSLITSKTINANIPYRPSYDSTCVAPGSDIPFGGTWRDPVSGNCVHGFAFDVDFDFADTVLPDEVIVALAYNTSAHGYAPLGVPGPYDSLNMSLASATPSVGTNVNSDDVFWNTSYAGFYTDGGTSGVGMLRQDTAWTGYVPVIKITASDVSPSIPSLLTPEDGAHVMPSGLILDWSDSTGDDPITYEYQSSLGGAVDADNALISPIYKTSTGSLSQINASGSSDRTYYWQVRACFSIDNCSKWSLPWSMTVDHVSPTADLIFPAIGPSATSFQVKFSEAVSGSDATNPANYFLKNWPGAGGSGILTGKAIVTYSPIDFTSTITFTTPGWYVSPEQEWGVSDIHDLAGNNQAINPYSEYSSPMLAPSTPGNPITTNSLTNSLTQSWSWTASTDGLGSGVKGYWQNIYNILTSTSSGWNWLGNVLGSTTNLTDGEWQLQIKAEDMAGNFSSVASSTNLIVDTSAPTKPVITSPANNLFTNTNFITLNWSGGDDTGVTQSGIKGYTIRYTFVPSGSTSSINWSSGLRSLGNPKTHSGTYGHGQGKYTMYIKTTDFAGNVSPESDPLVVTYDATPPSTPNLISPIERFVTQGVAFSQSWEAVESATLYEYQSCNTDPGDTGAVCTNIKFTQSLAGTIKQVAAGQPNSHFWWRVRARDAAGNWSTWSLSRELIIDNTAPVLSSKTVFDDSWHSTTMASTFDYIDNESSVVSGNNPVCDITTEGVAQTCTVTPIVCDDAGNCNTSSVVSNAANIDFSEPVSIITLPLNPGSSSTIITNTWDGSIAGTAEDLHSGVASVKVSIRNQAGNYFDGTLFVTSDFELLLDTTLGEDSAWSYNELLSPSEDNYTVKSHAIDQAGNTESTYVLTVVLDKTIPEVSISLNPETPDANNAWYKTQPSITLSGADTNWGTIEYRWDTDADWLAYSNPFTVAQEGAHVLYYRARDEAGNYSDTGIKNIKWDKTGLTSGPLNISVSPSPTSLSTSRLSWDSASDNIGISRYEVQWRLGDLVHTVSVGSEVRSQELTDLTEGSWQVMVRAYDDAGNTKEATTTLVVDKTAPASPTLTLTATSAGSASLSWSTVEGASQYILWYGTSSGTYQYGANVGNVNTYTVQGLGEGSYYFVVRSIDQAGNGSGNSNEVATGTIAGAPGVEPGAQAAGFTQDPQVLGDSTQGDGESEAVVGESNGSVLGDRTFNWWYLLLIPFILLLTYFLYFRLKTKAH